MEPQATVSQGTKVALSPVQTAMSAVSHKGSGAQSSAGARLNQVSRVSY